MGSVLFLLFAGFVAGTMNAAGGGGSFVTLLARIAVGAPPVSANASSTVALFPGSVVSTWTCRRRLSAFGDVSLRALLATSLAGGLAGAVLLLSTSQAAFDVAIPWVLLVATLMFAAGRPLGMALRQRVRVGRAPVLVAQFVLGIYAGYFGGAAGIMMLAVWSLQSSADLPAMNPSKTLMVGAANAIAVVCFIVAGRISWLETVPVLRAAIVLASAVGLWLQSTPASGYPRDQRPRAGAVYGARTEGACSPQRACKRSTAVRINAPPRN